MKLQKFENELLNVKVGCFTNNKNEIFFRGKDIATALGYENTTQAIIINVDDYDKQKLEEIWDLKIDSLSFNEKNTMYINESGLYSLILRSNKEEAKQFKSWITSEVIPSIRKTGQYSITLPINKQLSIFNEKDLHYNVIKFIRNNFYEPIIITPLGENQITSEMRIDSYNKGYTKGAPDILLLNYHKYFNGLAIELKTPKGDGELNDYQEQFLDKLDNNNYKIIVSNDFTNIIMALIEYKQYLMFNCKLCCKHFYSIDSRDNHYKYFHKNAKVYEI
jgi:prophage antirepressor-like protein